MTEREREAETQAEGEAGSMREPDVGLDPKPPASCLGPKTGTKPRSHAGIPCRVSVKRMFLPPDTLYHI